MARACGTVPEQSTRAAFLSSLPEERVALCRAMLLGCAEQGVFGGPPCAVDGLTRSAHAAQAWRGPCEHLRQKQEQ
jgi:hypothetical protein